MLKRRYGMAVSTATAAFFLSVSANAATIYPVNDGFEVPNAGSGGYSYANQGAGSNPNFSSTTTAGQRGFEFVGPGAGVAANGSAFGVNGASNGNHDGTLSTSGQAGFLQGGNGTLADVPDGPDADNLPDSYATYVSQGFTVAAGETATLVNLIAEGRRGGDGSNQGQSFRVFIDGTNVSGDLTPVVPSQPTPLSFTSYAVPVDVAAGSHTLAIVGNNTTTDDRTVFIDNLSITTAQTPEPASAGILAIAGLGLLRRRSGK